jgi:hypothetical protein
MWTVAEWQIVVTVLAKFERSLVQFRKWESQFLLLSKTMMALGSVDFVLHNNVNLLLAVASELLLTRYCQLQVVLRRNLRRQIYDSDARALTPDPAL